MNNLILVRHGQSIWNRQKRFTGWVDVNLSEEGKIEAKKSGELIRNLDIDIDICFTSFQKRSINTLKIILAVLNKKKCETKKAWQLNERHYGALTGLNKGQMIKKLGKEQVHIWRRAWDIPPPAMEKSSPFHPSKVRNYNDIPKNKIPNAESLKNTFERVIPYYEKNVLPLISKKKNVLISAHGNSLRALCKKLFKISNNKISEFEIPTGNPLLIVFNNNRKLQEYKYLDSNRAKKILSNI